MRKKSGALLGERKRDQWRYLRFLGCFAMCLFGVSVCGAGKVKASDYDNAREFFESTGTDGYHAKVYDGTIYYATQAKLASNSNHLRYGTVGYDISLTANGQTVSFAVKRVEDGSGDIGSMKEVPGSRVSWNGYEYNLYSISRKELEALAQTQNKEAAKAIFNDSQIHVRIDAIMTTKQYGKMHGGVSENGSGGLHVWGTVYHLKNEGELAALKRRFAGHSFLSFYKIERILENYVLSVQYKLEGGAAEKKGYGEKEDVLQKNGKPVATAGRLMEELVLTDPQDVGLQKAGFHMETGREWSYQGRSFSPEERYWPSDIFPDIAKRDAVIYMMANWQPNTYTIQYDGNGGSGFLPASQVAYQGRFSLKKGFTRKGYDFIGYAVIRTSPEGEKSVYCDGKWRSWEKYKNRQEQWATYQPKQDYRLDETWISGGSTDTFTFLAQWKESIFKITTDKQKGSGGTDKFYEKYGIGWYGDAKGKEDIVSITVPSRKGYSFLGYYVYAQGYGRQIVDKKGRISQTDAGYFTEDSKVYANWEQEQYVLTFDKQKGSGGLTGDGKDDKYTVAYQDRLPDITAPVRDGYEFQGYFAQKNGKGRQYYNERAIPIGCYEETENRTVYAYWKDYMEPSVSLRVEPDNWTNLPNGVKLTAVAKDDGSGLSSVELYQGEKLVAQKTGLKNVKTYTLTYYDKTEGSIPYRAVATDMEGNKSDVQNVEYYDVTAPKGQMLEGKESHEGTNLEVELFVTDYKIK